MYVCTNICTSPTCENTALLRRGKSQPRVVVNQIRQKGQQAFFLICGCRSIHSLTVRLISWAIN